MTKTRITLSVDEDTRKLIDRYGGKRAIGKFFTDLVKHHHFEETFGTKMLREVLERIENHILELLAEGNCHEEN